ncbi:DUF3141 domain-containing protein [Paenalcaligenes niemegkensis]|uniref:DUF3141 domain-containing protein n=1 Tax=Paenalcaligenes niemegkensis TaxID=2895469 RepID=UPI001EE94958|nr:DUF3141 domain-containing protein [Paenalcaligenes niemegkensis]MCQ9616095.1 DUF3141 domain-containing protein [Paenalcaligenes niemegkensis]
MSATPPHDSPLNALPTNPLGFGLAAWEYGVDAWQRLILYADVQRQRGDQYREHLALEVPTVLSFPCEPVLSGRELEHPVNYWLVRITPGPDQTPDPRKRPFIVVDPRAGHGPGIGGFKPESEIGAALNAGHPCYFVGFTPDPEPGQTVEDVMRAEAAFVRKVGELHPESVGKPAVIGNCQAGWQILMAAALWPELFGPIIVAGAPMSYWAGDAPMRYTGGLVGGSWLAAFTSDLGNGHFDGAWLVQNFESLSPANTWWSKNHHLYSNIDTEAPRYLQFEKYWGGYVYLNDVEMQYIVDNLFIGNKLSTVQLRTSDGQPIDLRNIRSPIVVFSSYGDNITPPPQALGWITDLYRSDAEVVENDQTIVYATHESIGHLGIFVSSKVGSKEHAEFANNIELINLLPAGIYQASVDDVAEDERNPIHDPYRLNIRGRSISAIQDIVKDDPESNKRFARAANVSEQNLDFYKSVMQPWVKALSTPQSARFLQATHPLRTSYEWWSSANPMAAVIKSMADQVRETRQPVAEENPFWQWQKQTSSAIEDALNLYRDQRDQQYENWFKLLYSYPVQDLHNESEAKSIPQSFKQPTEYQREQINHAMTEGGLLEAGVRAIFYMLQSRGSADERHFEQAKQLHECPECDFHDTKPFRLTVREQAKILTADTTKAVSSIGHLLREGSSDEIRQLARRVFAVATAGTQISPAELERLNEVLEIFEQAAQQNSVAEASPVSATPHTATDREHAAIAKTPSETSAPATTSTEKPAIKRPARKSTVTKTTAAKKTAIKKAVAKKTVAKKSAVKKSAAKTRATAGKSASVAKKVPKPFLNGALP